MGLIFGLKAAMLLLWKKEEIHLAINGWNGPVRDFIFYFLTYAGDGLFALALILVTLFIRFRYALSLALSFLGSGVVSQLMKRLFFAETIRPVPYFRALETPLNLVEGVHYHFTMSFPSGHSASAYALFILLALFTRNKMVSVFFVLLAASIAFSRVYLSQHFLWDTLMGGMIGFVAAWITFYGQQRWSASWLDKSLLTLRLNKHLPSDHAIAVNPKNKQKDPGGFGSPKA
ncbi:MAG: hypothetical protein CSA95_05595 [Bacteroidetes bacterium]|nr:MAG: hypothetical protein CSA95_05595 [Bacteroidota bacterium]